jgi:hypothetical protein
VRVLIDVLLQFHVGYLRLLRLKIVEFRGVALREFKGQREQKTGGGLSTPALLICREKEFRAKKAPPVILPTAQSYRICLGA